MLKGVITTRAGLVALRKKRSGHQRRGGKEVEVEEAEVESVSLLEPGRLGVVQSYTTLERLGNIRVEFSDQDNDAWLLTLVLRSSASAT